MTLGIKECPKCRAWKAPSDFFSYAAWCIHCAMGTLEGTDLISDIAAELSELTMPEAYNRKIAEYLIQAGVKDV